MFVSHTGEKAPVPATHQPPTLLVADQLGGLVTFDTNEGIQFFGLFGVGIG
ncbi:hypothetical protein BMS3Abin02_01466 [bacterium BMS3Abin02]|nr:hypothetical protein BMS3Abin02_01466 [bacterium BMS3Abin02]